MSGEKVARATLAARRQAQLEREHQLATGVMSDVASACNLARQAQAVIEQLGAEAETYMRAWLAEFDEARTAVNGKREEVDRLLAEFTSVARRPPTAETITQARILRAEVQRQGKELSGAARALRERADSMARDLLSAKSESLRRAFERDRVRRELEGLRAELDERLASRSPGGLQWMRNEAEGLRSELDVVLVTAAEPEAIDATRVAGYRSRLVALVAAAEDLDRRDAERRLKLQLLDQALRDAGFVRTDDRVEGQGRREVIEIHHVDRSEHGAWIQSRAALSENLVIRMLGAAGADSLTCGPDTLCDTRIQEIVEKARRLGLEITEVRVKYPNGDYGENLVSPAEFEAPDRPEVVARRQQRREE